MRICLHGQLTDVSVQSLFMQATEKAADEREQETEHWASLQGLVGTKDGQKASTEAGICSSPFLQGLDRTLPQLVSSPDSSASELDAGSPQLAAQEETPAKASQWLHLNLLILYLRPSWPGIVYSPHQTTMEMLALAAHSMLSNDISQEWSEIWDSTPEKASPPSVQKQTQPPRTTRRTGRKSRFYMESAGMPATPGVLAEPGFQQPEFCRAFCRAIMIDSQNGAVHIMQRQGQDPVVGIAAAAPALKSQPAAGRSTPTSTGKVVFHVPPGMAPLGPASASGQHTAPASSDPRSNNSAVSGEASSSINLGAALQPLESTSTPQFGFQVSIQFRIALNSLSGCNHQMQSGLLKVQISTADNVGMLQKPASKDDSDLHSTGANTALPPPVEQANVYAMMMAHLHGVKYESPMAGAAQESAGEAFDNFQLNLTLA